VIDFSIFGFMENELSLKNVSQPYAVTMSKHKLNTHEMRVMIRVIEGLQNQMAFNLDRDLFGNLSLEIKTGDLLPDGNKNYDCVRSALKSLREKTIEVKGKDDKYGDYLAGVGYINKYEYYMNNQKVRIQIDVALVSLYLELSNGFTRYAVAIAFNSSSAQAMKIYQFISHWKDKKHMTVDFLEFKSLLGLQDKYKKSGHFKSRVLDPVEEELKEKGDVYFSYSDIKTGSTVTGFVFHIHKRVITEEQKKTGNVMRAQVLNYIKTNFEVSKKELESIVPIVNLQGMEEDIIDKVTEVKQTISERRGRSNEIKKTGAYLVASLISKFEKHL
jgi:plasmid replication initiation protein